MASNRLPPKKDVALALLENATVFMHLDPRHEEVRVPPWFKRQPQLVLQIGLNMPVPILDLSVDDAAVSCTLSFNRSPYPCYVPWKSIYALVGEDGRGMVWPEDIPPEVAAQAQARAPDKAPAPPQPKPAHLRAVSKADSTLQARSSRATGKAQSLRSVRGTGEAAEKKKRTRRKAQRRDASEGARAQTRRRPPLAPVDAAKPAAARPLAAEPSGPSSAGPKRKRELPPYLRVVK